MPRSAKPYGRRELTDKERVNVEKRAHEIKGFFERWRPSHRTDELESATLFYFATHPSSQARLSGVVKNMMRQEARLRLRQGNNYAD